MSIHFNENLKEALQDIGNYQYHQLFIYDQKRISDDIIKHYGRQKWQIVDLLNERYSQVLKDKFDLYNWLNYNQNDEVAYFLNEAGSNCLSYAEHKIPHKFHLWLGR